MEAFDALIKFLEAYCQHNPTSAPAIEGRLDLLYYSTVDEDGVPNTGDPNAWSDWLEAVVAALEHPRA
ncbi:MAG TPA: hypothetical protein VFH62_05055 [Dehalococcoidia bacterium]|nr:hypothetical protein [Dehalococcoidia bacterium]